MSAAGAADDGPAESWVIDGRTGEQWFEHFYALYSRKGSKNGPWSAHMAFMNALRRDGLKPILDGVERWRRHWNRERTGAQFIPLAPTWLNQRRYLDIPEATKQDKAASLVQAAANNLARQADEVEQALLDGNDELAWKLVVSKAAATDDRRWFAQIARQLARGDDDEGVELSLGCTPAQIAAVHAAREDLRRRATPHPAPPPRPLELEQR